MQQRHTSNSPLMECLLSTAEKFGTSPRSNVLFSVAISLERHKTLSSSPAWGLSIVIPKGTGNAKQSIEIQKALNSRATFRNWTRHLLTHFQQKLSRTPIRVHYSPFLPKDEHQRTRSQERHQSIGWLLGPQKGLPLKMMYDHQTPSQFPHNDSWTYVLEHPSIQGYSWMVAPGRGSAQAKQTSCASFACSFSIAPVQKTVTLTAIVIGTVPKHQYTSGIALSFKLWHLTHETQWVTIASKTSPYQHPSLLRQRSFVEASRFAEKRRGRVRSTLRSPSSIMLRQGVNYVLPDRTSPTVCLWLMPVLSHEPNPCHKKREQRLSAYWDVFMLSSPSPLMLLYQACLQHPNAPYGHTSIIAVLHAFLHRTRRMRGRENLSVSIQPPSRRYASVTKYRAWGRV